MGRVRGRSSVVRPPWSVSEFEDLCDQCGDCIKACNEKIIFKGDGGYPEIDFSTGGCEFCEDCLESCTTQALSRKSNTPWRLKASIKTQCLSSRGIVCRSCSDACGQRAITFHLQIGGKSLPQLNKELCDGCGFCFSVCPEQAIELKEAS
jgi:ferredoxin-type protein NapF